MFSDIYVHVHSPFLFIRLFIYFNIIWHFFLFQRRDFDCRVLIKSDCFSVAASGDDKDKVRFSQHCDIVSVFVSVFCFP